MRNLRGDYFPFLPVRAHILAVDLVITSEHGKEH